MAKKRKKQATAKTLPLSQTIFLLLIGFVLGPLFTIANSWAINIVSEDECIPVETQFSGYRAIYRQFGVKGFDIDCSDGNTYEIDFYDTTEEIKNKIPLLQEGDELSLLIHPKENRILELTIGEDTLITFEGAQKTLKADRYFTIGVIILFCFCAFTGLLDIIQHIIKWKKSHNSLSKK